MKPADFLALRSGTVDGWKYQHSVVPLGDLIVSSGQLEASDPFVELGDGITVEIPPGTYPAFVTLADVSDEQDGSHLRETFLSLVIADGEVARIETFLPEDAEPDDDGEFYYGVSVDAGTVAFADAEAVARCMPDDDDWYGEVFDNDTDESWFSLMDSPEHFREGSANIVMPHATAGENVVLTHSGWGDGLYPLLTTYDAGGELLGVHIDLQVDERIDDGAEPDAAPAEEPIQEEPPAEPKGFFGRLFGR